MSYLVAIVGPTAVGKSKLALELSRIFSGEIVSADSRQVYRRMDIGTAKPTPEEQALVPHHLIDVVDPDDDFNLALYQRMAREAIDDIRRRGKLAFLVGGSGLYVWSILEGWRIPAIAPDSALRQELEAKAEAEGADTLHKELQKLDPVAAERIDPRNVRRVIRAIEVRHRGGDVPRFGRKEPFLDYFAIGLTAERDDLYHRIDARVDQMVTRGLIEEVEGLVSAGYGLDLPSMSGLGYKQIGAFLSGEIDLSTAIERIKYDTHRFVRHQYSWFSLRDKRIRWFDSGEKTERTIIRSVKSYVTKRKVNGRRVDMGVTV
jgi:tRNA dimethylallyltransferase